MLVFWRLKHWIAKNNGINQIERIVDRIKHMMKWWKIFPTGYLDHLCFVVRVLFIIFMVFTFAWQLWLSNAFFGNIYSARTILYLSMIHNSWATDCLVCGDYYYWTELIFCQWHIIFADYCMLSFQCRLQSIVFIKMVSLNNKLTQNSDILSATTRMNQGKC